MDDLSFLKFRNSSGIRSAALLFSLLAEGVEREVYQFERNLRKLRKCLYLYIGVSRNRGLGVFTAKAVRGGDIIMTDQDGDYFDPVLSYHQLCERGYPVENTLQVDVDAFRLPTGTINDFTNHSCDPNSGIQLTERGTIILALRDIAAHEELTYDYSTYLNNPYESMECFCGAANCRGIVGNFATLPDALQRRYRTLGIVGAFALRPPEQESAAD